MLDQPLKKHFYDHLAHLTYEIFMCVLWVFVPFFGPVVMFFLLNIELEQWSHKHLQYHSAYLPIQTHNQNEILHNTIGFLGAT